MEKDQKVTHGGCLCGATRFRVTGVELGAGYCHCTSCRRHTGAPLVAFVVFEETQVKWLEAERSRYQSSSGKFRSFCAKCGASIAFEDYSGDVPLIEFYISALDNPDAFPPNEHTHFAERISWLCPSDDLKKYEGSMRQ